MDGRASVDAGALVNSAVVDDGAIVVRSAVCRYQSAPNKRRGSGQASDRSWATRCSAADCQRVQAPSVNEGTPAARAVQALP
jgi:hypothetical protein